MYLIGNFTWWEADENYRLTEQGKDIYMADVELIADGQPYDFKFADKHWTPGYSCGNTLKNQGSPLSIGRVMLAECFEPKGNFQFTPAETGIYRFVIDFSDAGSPKVSVSLK